MQHTPADAATVPTWSILRSTDDGVTWKAFKTFNRDATANPTTAIRHGHSVMYDSVSQRVYFLTGDGENAAGIYRQNAAGTDVETVMTNALAVAAGCRPVAPASG